MEKKRVQHSHARRIVMAGLAAALAVGCPLPYQYSQEGWAGNAGAADPSSPSITAGPTLTYSSSVEGGTIADTQTASTSADTTIALQTATAGSVIYYTTDGTTPDPRAAQTRRYTPGSPITLAIATPTCTNCSRSLMVKASAIGPNMKPSLVMSATVNLQYPQAAKPSFSIPGGSGYTYSADQYLELSTTTAGAKIYYTMVSGPSTQPVPGQAGTSEYGGPILVNGPSNTWTITAIAVKAQMFESTASTASYTVTYDGLADPTFNPPSTATFANPAVIQIDSGVGSTIWYTTDGTAPVVGSSSSVSSGGTVSFAGGVPGTGALTLRAIAAQTGMNPSAERTASYLFRAATPSRSVPGGTYSNDQYVALSTTTGGAAIHYSVDGTQATPSSAVYASQLLVNSGPKTIRSIAVKSGYANSVEQADTYILKVAPPNFSPAPGDYPKSVQAALSDATVSPLTFYYTTNGTPPSTGSAVYSTPLTMPNGASTQIRVFAAKAGYTNSEEASATYVIPAVPTGPVVRGAWTNSIFVSWAAVPSANSYVILRDTSPSFPSPYYLYSTITHIEDTGLSQGVSYYYKVKAVYAAGQGDPSVAASAVVLLPAEVPSLQTVTTTGFAAPPVPPTAPLPDSWTGTKQPGWLGAGLTFVVWDPNYQNWSTFAIAAYDSTGALVGYWMINGNRYITSITLDSATGTFAFVGQSATSFMHWYEMMP